eukprot:jgi/Bigna1/83034/fgenesh1_pg.101_\
MVCCDGFRHLADLFRFRSGNHWLSRPRFGRRVILLVVFTLRQEIDAVFSINKGNFLRRTEGLPQELVQSTFSQHRSSFCGERERQSIHIRARVALKISRIHSSVSADSHFCDWYTQREYARKRTEIGYKRAQKSSHPTNATMQGDTKDMYPPLHRGHDSKDPEDDEKRPFLARGREEDNGAEQPRRLDSDTAASLPVDPNRKFEGFLSLFPNWASIGKPFFCERGIRAKAWCLSISTVILTLFQVSVFVGFSYASRNFNTALQKKDNESFYRSIAVFLGLILIACPIFTLGRGH